MKTRMIAAAIALAAISGSALAQATITLHSNQLPSEQGWTYQAQGLHAGTAEVSAFTPGSSALAMNTMGAGMNLTSSYLGARNFINETNFFEWDEVTTRKYFSAIPKAQEVDIPKLNEMAYEQVDVAGVTFKDFIDNRTADGQAGQGVFQSRLLQG